MEKLQVVLMHWHLKPGGCTSVLKNQYLALRREGIPCLVLCGKKLNQNFPGKAREIDSLAYAQMQDQEESPFLTAQKINQAIRQEWPEGRVIVHVHNPLLKKNSTILKVLAILRDLGHIVIVQQHDWAEDFRAKAYHQEEYPENCHVVVVNRRDENFLLDCGLKKEGVHYLPNQVKPLPLGAEDLPYKKFVLYAVRAIRRKNIGEAILFSLFFPPGQRLLITQPPTSPSDLATYGEWKDFCERFKLPVVFEAGERFDFPSLAGGAEYFLTTSVNEGFGFSVLEPWTIGQAVFGRYLPDVYQDFRDVSMDLDHLYRGLSVPCEFFSRRGYLGRLETDIYQAATAYGEQSLYGDFEDYLEGILDRDWFDFGGLDEIAQRQVLVRILQSKSAYEFLKKFNRFLGLAGQTPSFKLAINASLVDRHFGQEKITKELLKIYQTALNTPLVQKIDKQALLYKFFTPKNFSPLKLSL